MKITQKFFSRIIGIVMLLGSISSTATAGASRTEPGWEPTPTEYDAFVVAKSATRLLPPSYSGAYFSAISMVNSAYGSVQSSLAAEFGRTVNEKVGNFGANLNGSNFKLTGPITINFNWNGSGHDVDIGGFGFQAYVSVSGRQNGVRYSCSINISAANLSFRGKYDWNQGRITDVAASDPPLSRGVNCDTSLSWIPIIGNIADAIAEKFAMDKMDGFGSINELVERKIAADGVFDMSRLIPAGTLIDPDSGLDLGAPLYQKNALFPKNSIRIALQNEAERPPFVYDWNSYYNGSTLPLPKAQYPVFSVDVSGRLKYGLTLYEERTYQATWECPFTHTNCDAPL